MEGETIPDWLNNIEELNEDLELAQIIRTTTNVKAQTYLKFQTNCLHISAGLGQLYSGENLERSSS